ncbi:hypothetical protein GGR53DRAFT_462840 [Hypoxylon sp. FL1150]|nr:hypothetical protein GGR53DRAFT_462840 [Hypoxylon sp. FL1150]
MWRAAPLVSMTSSLLEANPEPNYDSIFGVAYPHSFMLKVLRLYPLNSSACPLGFEAFLQGPRISSGRNFALAEVKTVLVELLAPWQLLGVRRREWGAANKRREECRGVLVRFANPSLTLRSTGGLRVRFERL